MYDWIYQHFINTIWFLFIFLSIPFIGLIYLGYRAWKDQPNEDQQDQQDQQDQPEG
jgi:threonine/homoserine/homoserine lactone efflux protein